MYDAKKAKNVEELDAKEQTTRRMAFALKGKTTTTLPLYCARSACKAKQKQTKLRKETQK